MATRTEITEKGIRSEVWGEDSIIDTLQHELLSLKDKLESARKREDYGTYKNLILAFKEVVHLVHEEEEKAGWKNMYSHYYDGKYMDNEFVSTWEQKGDDIRNHKIYKIEKQITNAGERMGMALKSIFEKYQNYETKKNIESVIKRNIDKNESLFDVLKSLSSEWNNFSEDNKKCISRTIVGMRDEDIFMALLDNLK